MGRCRHVGLQAGDGAGVIGAPDVDELLVAAGELVAVVRDVGQQVGGLAVALHEDAVLVVTEVGGAQPGGRSEEHTSELQSLMRISYAVFCLKKKIKTRKI